MFDAKGHDQKIIIGLTGNLAATIITEYLRVAEREFKGL